MALHFCAPLVAVLSDRGHGCAGWCAGSSLCGALNSSTLTLWAVSYFPLFPLIGSTGTEKCLENLISIVFSRYGLKKYRQKYRHFSKCPRSAPRYVVGPEFSCAEPPKAELYASKLRATIDAKKQAANLVQADNDQWLLAPKAEPYTAQEASDAQQRIDKLNRALGKYNNVAPAAVLSDAPTATMAWGRSVARTLGYNVTFIRPNPDFHGVAVGGEAFVSASAEHPEIGLTSEAS